MVTSARLDGSDYVPCRRFNDSNAAALAALRIVANPQILLVRLHRCAHRHRTCRNIFRHLECIEINHRHLASPRHTDKHRLLVGGLGPVCTGPLQRDTRVQAGNARDADHRIDNRNRRILVQHHDVVTVQVDHRPHADHALQILADALPAFE